MAYKAKRSSDRKAWDRTHITFHGSEDFFCQFFWFFFVMFFVFPCFSFGFLNMPSGSAYPPPLVGILFWVFSWYFGEFCWFSASAGSSAVPHVRNLTTSNDPWGSKTKSTRAHREFPPPPHLQTQSRKMSFARDSYEPEARLGGL